MNILSPIIIIIILIVLFYVMRMYNYQNKEPNKEPNKENMKQLNFRNRNNSNHNFIPKPLKKITNRNCHKIRKNILNNKFQTSDSIDLDNVIDLIYSKFVVRVDDFNFANKPTTNRKFDKHNSNDKILMKNIISNINEWNILFQKCSIESVYIDDIHISNILETENECILTVRAILIHGSQKYHIEMNFYGVKDRYDDFFTTGACNYNVVLFSIEHISSRQYHEKSTIDNPFMTMEQQLEYVKYIEKIHQDEINDN